MATEQQRENAELDGTSAAVPTRAAGEALSSGHWRSGTLSCWSSHSAPEADALLGGADPETAQVERLSAEPDRRAGQDLERPRSADFGNQLREIEGERFLALLFDMWIVDSKHQIPPEIQA